MLDPREDVRFMRLALDEAERAAEAGDVPVGAVLVRDGVVVASGHNEREVRQDPTAHAEVVVLRQAAQALGSWRLERTVLYVTLEPCPMCAGAMWLARVQGLVFGAKDEKAGAAGTLYNVAADPRLNHRLVVEGGVLAEESQRLLRAFFRGLRGQDAGYASEGCPSG